MRHVEGNTQTVTLEAVLLRDNLRAAWLAVKANQGAAAVGCAAKPDQQPVAGAMAAIQ